MTNKRRRNSTEVKMDLLEGVGKALTKYGHTHLGINNVSLESRVEKATLYRHYADFNDLLRTYVEKQDFWVLKLRKYEHREIRIGRTFIKNILIEQFETLYKNKELQKLLIWELGDMDDIVTPIALKREVMAQRLLKKGEGLLLEQGLNFNFIIATFIAGIHYLVLHKDKSTFCNVDINAKSDRLEFIKTIEWLVDLVFDKADDISKAERIAINAYKAGVEPEKIAEFTELSIERIHELIT